MQHHGAILRNMPGDIVAFSPPLIISEAEIDEMMAGFAKALETEYKKPGEIDVRAGGLHLVVGHAEGRDRQIDGDADLASLLDVVERVGVRGAGEEHARRQQRVRARFKLHTFVWHHFVPVLSWTLCKELRSLG